MTGNVEYITVKTRKEFAELFRKMFIPDTVERWGKEAFDFGSAISTWTSFFNYVPGTQHYHVELIE